jgi:hypothetical protein
MAITTPVKPPPLTFDQALPIVKALCDALSDSEKMRLLEWANKPRAEEIQVKMLKQRKGNGPSSQDDESKKTLMAVSGKLT